MYDVVAPVRECGLYAEVEHASFVHDQRLDCPRLIDLVVSRSYCAVTRLDLADRGPGPALLMAWTVNR